MIATEMNSYYKLNSKNSQNIYIIYCIIYYTFKNSYFKNDLIYKPPLVVVVYL